MCTSLEASTWIRVGIANAFYVGKSLAVRLGAEGSERPRPAVSVAMRSRRKTLTGIRMVIADAVYVGLKVTASGITENENRLEANHGR